VPYGF